MDKDYSWPGMFKPFDHQRETSKFLISHKRAFCFNEAGTGKTSSVVWAADYLMDLGLVKRVLIICPLSIMYSAWQSDIFKTAMHRKAAVAYGTTAKRKKVLEGDYEFVIINYDGVSTVKEEIRKADFDLIVMLQCSMGLNFRDLWRYCKGFLLRCSKLDTITQKSPACHILREAVGN